MKIRDKRTANAKIVEVPDGSLIPSFYEVVNEDDLIKVGEPTLEATIEEPKEAISEKEITTPAEESSATSSKTEQVKPAPEVKPKKKPAKKGGKSGK